MPKDHRQTAMWISLAVSFLMLAGKLTAYALTHSTALLADAAESVVHCAATGFAAFSLWYAARPADRSHPYGHGRIAYISVGFEGTLVFAASVAVIYCGVDGLIAGVQLRRAALGLGLGIATGLAVINIALATFLIQAGKKHRSLILTANGKHVLSDVWTTATAIVGLGAVTVTGIEWLDPVAAIGIGGYIMINGFRLLRKSVAGLMDELEPELSKRLMVCLEGAVRDHRITGFHQLRCRSLNDEVWIDIHIQVPGDLRLIEAHGRATQIEASLRALFPHHGTHVITHVEPEDHEGSHPTGHEMMTEPLGPTGSS